MDKITDETNVGTTELAAVLGVTARRVQQMAQDGTLPTVSKGKFALCDSVQRYITFVSVGKVSEDEQKAEKVRRMSEAKIKAAKATIATLEAQELQGKMHRAEDVQAVTEDMASYLRSLLMGLPGRLAVDITNARSAAETSTIIRDAVYAVMGEMAQYQYDPSKYAEKVRERKSWEQLTDVISDDDES